MKKVIAIVFLLLQSCAINGNLKGLYSYYKSTNKAKPELFSNEKWNCESKKDNRIKIINGKDLAKCISSSPRSMVYIWAPLCKSETCYPLEEIQKFCSEREIELFIVAEYYDLKQMDKIYSLKNPILGIDTQYYGTDITSKYVSFFLKDINIESFQHRYVFYERGEFKRNIYDLFNDKSLQLESLISTNSLQD